MSIAPKIQSFLHDAGIDYQLIDHRKSHCSEETARRSMIPRCQLAKGVVVHHADGFAMSVVPSDRNVHLNALQDILHYRLRLAREDEIADLFSDCDAGAVPPFGFLYGINTIVDHELEDIPKVYFEAGDHETVVQVSPRDFETLMHDTLHADVSCSPHRA